MKTWIEVRHAAGSGGERDRIFFYERLVKSRSALRLRGRRVSSRVIYPFRGCKKTLRGQISAVGTPGRPIVIAPIDGAVTLGDRQSLLKREIRISGARRP